jgi:hypothetical protein
MSSRNTIYKFIDFLRLPRPHVERRKSIYSPEVGVNKLIFKLFWVSDTLIHIVTLIKKNVNCDMINKDTQIWPSLLNFDINNLITGSFFKDFNSIKLLTQLNGTEFLLNNF